jgi:DhnA family fructose-bisphosphate aldolase class Ia
MSVDIELGILKMNVGKQIRLNRLFSDPSGKFCSLAIDHFMLYESGLPNGLRDLPGVLETLIPAKPDAVTMNKGVVASCWGPYAGRVPLILQGSGIVRPDDRADEFLAVPEDAVRLGADAFAVVAFVRGKTEAAHLRRVADFVRQAEAWDMPVVMHVYARKFSASGQVEISTEPEEVAWAVRCGVEVGVDVIKASYTGDVSSYSEIVRSCPVRLVAASGPTTETVRESLEMAAGVMAGGARGMTIGRNIWGAADPEKALEAFKMVIHGGASADQALEQMGLG